MRVFQTKVFLNREGFIKALLGQGSGDRGHSMWSTDRKCEREFATCFMWRSKGQFREQDNGVRKMSADGRDEKVDGYATRCILEATTSLAETCCFAAHRHTDNHARTPATARVKSWQRLHFSGWNYFQGQESSCQLAHGLSSSSIQLLDLNAGRPAILPRRLLTHRWHGWAAQVTGRR